MRFQRAAACRTEAKGSKIAMLDIGMAAIGVGFFVVAILYVLACEKM